MCKTDEKYVTVQVIKCSDGNYGLVFKNSNGEPIKVCNDVYTDHDEALKFSDKCNRAGLCECHISDVLEDFLQ